MEVSCSCTRTEGGDVDLVFFVALFWRFPIRWFQARTVRSCGYSASNSGACSKSCSLVRNWRRAMIICWISIGMATRVGAGATAGVGFGIVEIVAVRRGGVTGAGSLSPTTSLAVLVHLRGVIDLKLAIKAS